jgi:Holliday junction resolvase RusA-like endonuclease
LGTPSLDPQYRKVKKDKLSSMALPASSIRADLDNLVKFVLDTMEGTAYVNDRQVVKITATKRWTKYMENTKTVMTVTKADEMW